jgi:peptide deformylase
MSRKRVKAKLIIAPNPLLTTVCEPVEDGEDVSGIIRDMMYVLTNEKSGVGLAAPQASHLKRIIIIKTSDITHLAMINPVIESQSCRSGIEFERCLSYPGSKKRIKRALEIQVSWDRQTKSNFLDGTRDTFADYKARIIQHEIDHLNGKCKVGEK